MPPLLTAALAGAAAVLLLAGVLSLAQWLLAKLYREHLD